MRLFDRRKDFWGGGKRRWTFPPRARAAGGPCAPGGALEFLHLDFLVPARLV